MNQSADKSVCASSGGQAAAKCRCIHNMIHGAAKRPYVLTARAHDTVLLYGIRGITKLVIHAHRTLCGLLS